MQKITLLTLRVWWFNVEDHPRSFVDLVLSPWIAPSLLELQPSNDVLYLSAQLNPDPRIAGRDHHSWMKSITDYCRKGCKLNLFILHILYCAHILHTKGYLKIQTTNSTGGSTLASPVLAIHAPPNFSPSKLNHHLT